MKSSPDKNVHLADLIDTKNPDAVLDEIFVILSAMFDSFNVAQFKTVFFDIISLFEGNYPGYQKCSTDYHDLAHTIEVLLAMAQLIHGYSINSVMLSEKSVLMGLISALMHDTGYIQTDDDTLGTGAKHTLTHVARSIDFNEIYFQAHGFSQSDFTFCKNCIDCTDITTDPATIVFTSHEEEVVAKMLGITDLIGQMADRNYLEKLWYLYYEFEEGNVPGFESELDLFRQTIGFFAFSDQRTTLTLGNLEKHMIFHFIERWSIHEDLYRTAIEKNKQYLISLVNITSNNLHSYLRRTGLLEELRKKNIFPRTT